MTNDTPSNMPKILGSPRQIEFAEQVLQWLLAEIPNGYDTSLLLSAECLDAAPLLDAWQQIEHRDRLSTPFGTLSWRYIVLNGAYPNLIKRPRREVSDPGDWESNCKKKRMIVKI